MHSKTNNENIKDGSGVHHTNERNERERKKKKDI